MQTVPVAAGIVPFPEYTAKIHYCKAMRLHHWASLPCVDWSNGA